VSDDGNTLRPFVKWCQAWDLTRSRWRKYAIACNRVRRDRRAPALNWAPHCVRKAILAKGFTKNVLVELRHAYRSVDKPLFAVHAPSVVDNVHG